MVNKKESAKQSQQEDDLWIRQHLSGDPNAFKFILRKYKNLIFNLCYQFLNNYEEANDCAQETFVKVWKHLDSFQGDSRFSTWIYRIALNNCKNKVKSFQYKMALKNSDISDHQHIPNPDKTPHHKLELKKLDQKVRSCILKLHTTHRELVLLRHMEGASYEEISKITKQNIGTIKSRLGRARKNLRICLKGYL